MAGHERSMSQDSIITRRDASEAKRYPHQYLHEVFKFPALVLQHKTLVRNFFIRELFGRFRGSLLGVLWVLIHPFFLFITYYLVFGVLFSVRGMPGQAMWYPLYLFLGVVIWTLFAETTMRCTTIIVDNANLIKKVAFPAQLLPVHLGGVNLLVCAVGIVAFFTVAGIATYYGSYQLQWPGLPILFLPLFAFLLLLFALGVGYALAAAHVFFRDTVQIFSIVITLWFFASPVIWHMKTFASNPDPETSAFLQQILPFLEMNPLYPLLTGMRGSLGLQNAFAKVLTFEEVSWLFVNAAIPACASFVIGFTIFRSLQYRFADEI